MADRKDIIKELHDKLLSEKPEGANHDIESCEICQVDVPNGNEGEIVETFTKEQLDAAVTDATAALRQEIAELKEKHLDAATAEAVDKAREDAKGEAAEEIAKLQGDLDAAQIEKNAEKERAEKAEKNLEDTLAYLTSEAESAVKAAEREGRKTERLEKVKEAANFSDEELATKADRWTDMDDAAFESLIEEYKEIASKSGSTGKSTEVPSTTVLQPERETAGLEGGVSALSYLADVTDPGYEPGRRF